MEYIVSPFEAKNLIQNLKPFSIEQIGSEKWMLQLENVQKLALQAHQNAISGHDEFIVDEISMSEKIPILVHELIVIETWTDCVFSHISSKISSRASCKVYIILYYQAVLTNLFEILFYHESIVNSAEESTLDLVDFCHRKLIQIISGEYKQNVFDDDIKNLDQETTESQLDRQRKTINFSVCASSLSIIRFLTDNINVLPPSVFHRILITNDTILNLVQLIEIKPFRRKNKEKYEKFDQQQWIIIEKDELNKLTRLEIQVWLALYNLLMDNSCRKKYEYTSFRKTQILLIKTHLNNAFEDQIPILKELRRFLEELFLMSPPNPTDLSSLIIEQLPEIHDQMLKEYQGKWQSLASNQINTVLKDDEKSLRTEFSRLAEIYKLDSLDTFWEEPKCARCGEPSTQRCSRCKQEWYCSRKCQVESWKTHKPLCDLVTK